MKDVKAKQRRAKITTALRDAAKKGKELAGFECPHKRCFYRLTLDEFKASSFDDSCGRCAAPVDTFTPYLIPIVKL